MRLLFCSTYPHLPDVIGGLQTTTDELCLFLAERGVEAIVLCGVAEHESAAAAVPPRADSVLGYRVIRVGDPVSALPAVAAAIDPSAIIVQTGPDLASLVVASLETGRPTAVYLHNVETHQFGGTLVADPALLYIANSRFTADRLRALTGADSLVLPPMVLPHRYITPTTGDRVLYVNPTQVKGVEIVLAMAEARPNIPFTIVESWHLDMRWRDVLLDRVRRLDHVEWLPRTQNVTALLARSRLLLMPSIWEEAYGRSAVEAQLSGLPVLASRRGALPDTVGDGGLLVDAHAPLVDWLAALDALYHDDAVWRERSTRARHHAQATVMNTLVALDHLLMRLAIHGAR